MLISEFMDDHKMFSKIQIEDLKTHTLYFKNDKIITEQSFEWHADGNFSKSHVHTSVHLNYYWKKDKVNKIDIVGFFSKKGELKQEDIGLIEVKDFFSFVAIKKIKVNDTLHLIKDEKIKNKKVKIDIAK